MISWQHLHQLLRHNSLSSLLQKAEKLHLLQVVPKIFHHQESSLIHKNCCIFSAFTRDSTFFLLQKFSISKCFFFLWFCLTNFINSWNSMITFIKLRILIFLNKMKWCVKRYILLKLLKHFFTTIFNYLTSQISRSSWCIIYDTIDQEKLWLLKSIYFLTRSDEIKFGSWVAFESIFA